MQEFVLFLSSTLPIVALACIFIIACVNGFLAIRKRVPATVNCWFCNSWIKVSYDKRNSFDCTYCLQYNGFDLDGDYNKVIPEQYVDYSNSSKSNEKPFKSFSDNYSNGLCKLCNNNQQLKVYQLANFVPLNEKNYDMEIEHFQKQLEKAYKLCKRCDTILKNTLDNQSRWLFSMRFLNENGIVKSINTIPRKMNDSMLMRTLLMLLTIILLLNVLWDMDFNIIFENIPNDFIPHAFYLKKSNVQNLLLESYSATLNKTEEIFQICKKEIVHVENIVGELYTSVIELVIGYMSKRKLEAPVRISFKLTKFVIIAFLSCCLHLMLLRKWKRNCLIPLTGWIIITVTYAMDSRNVHITYFQVFGILLIIYSLVTPTRRYNMKMERKDTHLNASTIRTTPKVDVNNTSKVFPKSSLFNLKEENDSRSFGNSYSSSSACSAYSSPYVTKTDHVFGSLMLNRSKSPSSFSEISSVSKHYKNDYSPAFSNYQQADNASSYCTNGHLCSDLNGSFLKLNIGNDIHHCHNLTNEPKKIIINKNICRPRPVISPAKLNFLENFDKCTKLPITNLSRSSSQSSGFISQTTNSDSNYESLPNTYANINTDVDSVSVLSEPIYQLIDKETQHKQISNYFYPLPGSKLLNSSPTYGRSEFSKSGINGEWNLFHDKTKLNIC